MLDKKWKQKNGLKKVFDDIQFNLAITIKS